MMHVQACLGARNDGESSFSHCGGLMKLVQAFVFVQERSRKQFSSPWRCFDTCRPVKVPGKIEKAIFTTVEVL